MNKVFRLAAAIAVCEGAGFAGSFFTTPAISGWYVLLNKPPFSPPNWIFAPVWIILYLLMGISLYLIWETKAKSSLALQIFFIQLALNIFWSIAFFGMHSPISGLIIIILLWYFIFQTIKAFSKINKTASILLYPYLVWVSFAVILNLAIWWLNK